MAEMKRDKKTLTKELKSALLKGRNFLYAPSKAGDPAKDVVVLSKKCIPPAKRNWAKLESGGPKVWWGACFQHEEDGIPVFETPKPFPNTLAKTLKAAIKKQTGLNWTRLEVRQNEALVETEFEDVEGEEAEEEAAPEPTERSIFEEKRDARLKAVARHIERLREAESPAAALVQSHLLAGRTLERNESWDEALAEYDKALIALKKGLAVLDGGSEDEAPDRSEEWAARLKVETAYFARLTKVKGIEKSALQELGVILKAASKSGDTEDWDHGFRLLGDYHTRAAKLIEAAESANAEQPKKKKRESRSEREARERAEKQRMETERGIQDELLLTRLPSGADLDVIKGILVEHRLAVKTESAAFRGIDWIEDALSLKKAERKKRLTAIGVAMENAFERRSRLAAELAKIDVVSLSPAQLETRNEAMTIAVRMTSHIPDDFYANRNGFLARIELLCADPQTKARALEDAKQPLDQETVVEIRESFGDAIDPNTLKSDWERHDFYFDQLTKEPTVAQLEAMRVSVDKLIAKGQRILDAGGKFKDVRATLAGVLPESWWPVRLVEQMQAWRKTEREFLKESIRDRMAEKESGTFDTVAGVLTLFTETLGDVMTWGEDSNVGWLSHPTVVTAVNKYMQDAKSGYGLGIEYAEMMQTCDYSRLNAKNAEKLFDAVLKTGNALIGAIKSVGSVVPVPADSDLVTTVIPGLGIAAAGINLTLALKALGKHIVIAAKTSTIQNEAVLQYARGDVEDSGAFVKALGNEMAARKLQIAKDSVDVTAKSVDLASAIGVSTGIGAPTAVALKVVGQAITYGGRVVFTNIEWGLARTAKQLIEEARAGNPIARIQLFEDCGRYAKMYIAIQVQEGNPLAQKIIGDRGIEEGDLDDATALKILREALLSSADQRDETTVEDNIAAENAGRLYKAGKMVTDKITEARKDKRAKRSGTYDPSWQCQDVTLTKENWDQNKERAVKDAGLYDGTTGIGAALGKAAKAIAAFRPYAYQRPADAKKKADKTKKGVAAMAALAELSSTIGGYSPITSPSQGGKDAEPEVHAGVTKWLTLMRKEVTNQHAAIEKELRDTDLLDYGWAPPGNQPDIAKAWKANWASFVAATRYPGDDAGVQSAADKVEKARKPAVAAQQTQTTALAAVVGASGSKLDKAKKAVAKANQELRKKNVAFAAALNELVGATKALFGSVSHVPGMRDYLLRIADGAQELAQEVDRSLYEVDFDDPNADKPAAARFTRGNWDATWRSACEAGVVDEGAGDGGISEWLKKKDAAVVALERAASGNDPVKLLQARQKVQQETANLLIACVDFSLKQKTAVKAVHDYVELLANKASSYVAQMDEERGNVTFVAGSVLSAESWQIAYDDAVKKGAVPAEKSAASKVKSALADWDKHSAAFAKRGAKGKAKRKAADDAFAALAQVQTAVSKIGGKEGYAANKTMGAYLSWLRDEAGDRLTEGPMADFKSGEGITGFTAPDFKWKDSEWQVVKGEMVDLGLIPDGKTGMKKLLDTCGKSWAKFDKKAASMKKADIKAVWDDVNKVVGHASTMRRHSKNAEYVKYFLGPKDEADARRQRLREAYEAAQA